MTSIATFLSNATKRLPRVHAPSAPTKTTELITWHLWLASELQTWQPSARCCDVPCWGASKNEGILCGFMQRQQRPGRFLSAYRVVPHNCILILEPATGSRIYTQTHPCVWHAAGRGPAAQQGRKQARAGGCACAGEGALPPVRASIIVDFPAAAAGNEATHNAPQGCSGAGGCKLCVIVVVVVVVVVVILTPHC
eukprot:1134390-Pelagomonas_calceolata.AAC.3